jgi:hypothetical protein
MSRSPGFIYNEIDHRLVRRIRRKSNVFIKGIRHNRLKKLRRLLGLPEKNMYISPGVYVQEHDFTLLKSSK